MNASVHECVMSDSIETSFKSYSWGKKSFLEVRNAIWLLILPHFALAKIQECEHLRSLLLFFYTLWQKTNK